MIIRLTAWTSFLIFIAIGVLLATGHWGMAINISKYPSIILFWGLFVSVIKDEKN